jgi:hypothetical protein
MRRFHLVRTQDVSGVSGTGIVAEGVEFHDGQCAMSWFGQFHTITLFAKVEDIINIHGHEGRTTLVWLDGGAK